MAAKRFSIAGNYFDVPRLAPALYVVSTPVGNLGDISVRALETLAGCDLVLCEDTRTSSKLLNAYCINTPRRSLHEHNEREQAGGIVDSIRENRSVCIISDAGTPLISDPGFPLVSMAIAQGVPVFAIPGASALLGALAAGGLPTNRFSFFGFLPSRQQAREQLLQELVQRPETLVFYESPGRVAATLESIGKILGGKRQIVVARELTKKFETFYRGSAESLGAVFSDMRVKGEIVVLVAGADASRPDSPDEWIAVLEDLLKDIPLRRAVDQIVVDFGARRKLVYKTALKIRDG